MLIKEVHVIPLIGKLTPLIFFLFQGQFDILQLQTTGLLLMPWYPFGTMWYATIMLTLTHVQPLLCPLLGIFFLTSWLMLCNIITQLKWCALNTENRSVRITTIYVIWWLSIQKKISIRFENVSHHLFYPSVMWNIMLLTSLIRSGSYMSKYCARN